MNSSELINLDLKHVWHPCSQMKDYEDFPPIPIASATGPYLITTDGKKLIDAISSWWCKSLGHAHPRVKEAVKKQLDKFEHIISANTCNETLSTLSAKLAELSPPLDKVFYADNGSTAVEIAMKMSLQYHIQTGATSKTRFAALKNGYHGETILTLGAGDCELYAQAYASLLPDIPKIGPLKYISGPDSESWEKYPEEDWKAIEKQLEPLAETLTAIMFEPLLQGASGMLIYSPDLLRKLRNWADQNNVHLIADEIMTGFGRTGKALACDYAGITPDFITISKGLTSGWGPMSATLCSTEVYEAFYGDYFSGKAFLHSNTYTGHAVCAAAALETLSIYEDENTFENVAKKSRELRDRLEYVAKESGALINLRGLGFVAAADIVNPETGLPFPKEKRFGYQCYQKAVKLGALLRHIGDTMYFLPPLNTPDNVLDDLAEIALKALKSTLKMK